MDLSQLCLEYPVNDLLVATNNLSETCKLGCGSFGSVYKGTMKDGTEVAIKVIDLLSESGFDEEVRVLSKFRHPNLVILMGFARCGTRRFLIYELLAGGDVFRRLQNCDSLPFLWQHRLSIALDAACGLSHLHNSSPKVFHRDIKSANILIDRNGTAKMADFGLACLSKSPTARVRQASGTVGYACPYYIQRGVVTEASEIFSFGMVLFELLCNAPPACAGSAPGEILSLVNHLKGDIGRVIAMVDHRGDWPQETARQLAELALQCSSMQESQRPVFIQVVKCLRKLLHATPSPMLTPRSPRRPRFQLTAEGSCFESDDNGRLFFGRKLVESVVTSESCRATVSRDHLKIERAERNDVDCLVTNLGVNAVILESPEASFLCKGDSRRIPHNARIIFFSTETAPITPFLELTLSLTPPPRHAELQVVELRGKAVAGVKFDVFGSLTFGYSSFSNLLTNILGDVDARKIATNCFNVKVEESGVASLTCLTGDSVTVACFRGDDEFKSCTLSLGDSTELLCEDFVRVNDMLVLRFMSTASPKSLRPAPALSPPINVKLSQDGPGNLNSSQEGWEDRVDEFTRSGFRPD